MMDLQPSIKRVCVVIDENNIIKKYSRCLSEEHVPYENGFIIEIDLDLDLIELVDNYRVVDGKLVELTEEEKQEIIKPQHLSTEEQIQMLQGQVAALEMMNAGLLLDNAQQQIKNNEQEVTNANILLEIAMLKGVL